MRKNRMFLCVLIILVQFTSSCQFVTNSGLSEPKVVVDTIFSQNLNEDRLLTIYLPKGYSESRTYPVVYAADGQIIVESYKKSIDSLLSAKSLPAFIMVGVHSNEKKIPDEIFEYRNYEYVKGFVNSNDTILNTLYRNHFKFFTQEMIQYVENKYSVSNNCKDRIFYGTSNGGGLGVSIGAENPKLFKNYICFSLAGGDYEKMNWNDSDYPFYNLSYGIKEPLPLIIGIKEFDKFLIQNKYKHELSSFDGGHDRKMWRKEFLRILPKILLKEKK